jgi:hypothetical protein
MGAMTTPRKIGHRPGKGARAKVGRRIARVSAKVSKRYSAEIVPVALRSLGLTKGGANPAKKRRRKARQKSQRRNRA